MTIRIKAPRAWTRKEYIGAFFEKRDSSESPVRIVRESDWKRLLKLVKEVDLYIQGCEREKQHMPLPLIHALDALKGAK